MSSMCVGLGCPRLSGTCVCVCMYAEHTKGRHADRNRVLMLADGVFSLEPKAQPSANIRDAQGQQD